MSGAHGTVTLLHGLNRTQLSMAILAARLRREGYRVFNRFYPTRARTIEAHADQLLQRLRRDVELSDGPFHFVGHSLGCLVVRCALHRCAPDELPLLRPGRFVMLGPPNQGSDLARKLAGSRFWDAIYGRRAFHQLADTGHLASWGTPPLPTGVIAGGKGDDRGWNPMLEGDDDGVVRVANTHVEGESDHIVLRAVHTTLPWRRDTARLIVRFLRHGRFDTMTDGGANRTPDRRTSR